VTVVDRRRLFSSLRSLEVLFLASSEVPPTNWALTMALLWLATQDHILIECGGRAQGAYPHSFRAEGYGILAILRLVFWLRHFYITRNASLRFWLYCDSESLLKRIAPLRALTQTITRRFLSSEVDVEMQILQAVTELESDVAFEHVEGHQDTKYPGRPLPRTAQLNQRCDEIATAHLDSATRSIPSVTFLPASKVSVTVRDHTVTHHIPTQLHTFSGIAGMQAHLHKHHQCQDPAIFDLIDWPMFHAATLSNSFLKRLFVLKWINSLLPFPAQQHLFNQSPSARCPSAFGCDEDWHHFPRRCSHPQRIHAWSAFLPVVSAIMEMWQLDPSLRRILLHLVTPLTHAPPIPIANLSAEYTARCTILLL
jgi:hypothetical protein